MSFASAASGSGSAPTGRGRNGNNNSDNNGSNNSGSGSDANKSSAAVSKTPTMSKAMITSSRRIQKELVAMSLDPTPNCSAGSKADNLYEWDSTILGPPGSVYEGGVFFLDIKFSTEYPFMPPQVTFRTRIYHCNINIRGVIYLDILKNNWSPTLTIAKVLLSIRSLLTNCKPGRLSFFMIVTCS